MFGKGFHRGFGNRPNPLVGGLLAQTKTQRDRILNNGGTIESGLPANLIDPVLRKLDGAAQLGNLTGFWAAGARSVVSGSQEWWGDWSGNDNDISQSTSSQRFTDTTDSKLGGKVVGSADNTDDFLSVVTPGIENKNATLITAYSSISNQTSGLLTFSDGTLNESVSTRIDGSGVNEMKYKSYDKASSDRSVEVSVGGDDGEGHILSLKTDGNSLYGRFDGGQIGTDNSVINNVRYETAYIGILGDGSTWPSAANHALAIALNAALSDSLVKDIEDIVSGYYGGVY